MPTSIHTRSKRAQALAAFNRTLLLAQILAREYKRKLPKSFELAELESVAIAGLWQAALSHHGLPSGEFEAMARTRIRGAIIDYLRSADWLPRYARNTYAKRFERVYIDELDVDKRSDLSYSTDPDIAIDAAAASRRLRAAVASLPDRRDRRIVAGLLKGLSQREVAEDIGISQGRLSQLLPRITGELTLRLRPGVSGS